MVWSLGVGSVNDEEYFQGCLWGGSLQGRKVQRSERDCRATAFAERPGTEVRRIQSMGSH